MVSLVGSVVYALLNKKRLPPSLLHDKNTVKQVTYEQATTIATVNGSNIVESRLRGSSKRGQKLQLRKLSKAKI